MLLAISTIVPQSPAQLTTGTIEGTLRTSEGSPAAGSRILITGGAGFRIVVHPNANGEFAATLPYGRYLFSGFSQPGTAFSGAVVLVAPLQVAHVNLVIDASGSIRDVSGSMRNRDTSAASGPPGTWTDSTRGLLYPEAFSLPGVLLSREPASVTEPLDLAGLSNNQQTVESQRGFSWTDTQFKLQGMDVTDSWQPGLPAILPDIEALGEIVVRSAFAQTTSASDGVEIGLFPAEPGAPDSGFSSWHEAISTSDAGASLSSTNLPPPPSRGLVQQADQFRWFTRDHVEIGGPLTRWADIYASGNGQWASQTEPLASPGTNQRSRLLFGNARGRVRVSDRDRLDALYSGSRLDLSGGSMPSGLEALTGNRMAPAFALPGGFPGQPETDHLDFLQAGWIHLFPATSRLGVIELRYGYSVAHLDTSTDPTGQSRIELLGGTVSGAPPLANLAIRARQEIETAWQPVILRAVGTRHRITAGGGWNSAEPGNRFTTPSNLNLITADGAPAYAVVFNTPLDSRELVRSFSGYLADQINLPQSLSFDLGVYADFARGSLPVQSSPAGTNIPARTFAAQPNLIVWNSVSPRAGVAWQVPNLHGLTLRGTYFRIYAPLAGRYLDFGNPNSLGGSVYQWITSNAASPFQASQQGSLLLRFGGPYSTISPSLRRPHSDEFDIGAGFPFAPRSFVRIHLFRRDDKDRNAAIDTGVPASSFTPVSIADPGPDGIPGTFDDQRLTVYAQNPATLGQDRYLLTNPAGLRMLNAGLLAEASSVWRGLTFHASFVAEKSYGPTNPGNSVFANDPGVIGALLLDPNTSTHASGRSFVDRAYVGKIQATYQFPAYFGGIQLASVADYMDGLPFARQLLVTGLPQGPFLVATTVRGSPEGGNRSEYAVNWNLRLTRQFQLVSGRLTALADILNVANAAQRLQENDLSGPSFNLRLPVAIQPARAVRVGVRYEF